jgi:sorting nexin-4
VLKEHTVFELSKKEEMKDLLGTYADGQIEMLQKVGSCIGPEMYGN